MSKEIVIVAAKRTAIGNFLGGLASFGQNPARQAVLSAKWLLTKN